MGSGDGHLLFRVFTTFRTYAEGVTLAILVALAVRYFVLTPYVVPNEIMSPSLVAGDYIMAYRLPYGVRVPLSDWKWGEKMPQRGDLVLFPCPGSESNACVRRVIGLPGDRVEIRGERLILNGEMARYEPVPSASVGFQFKEVHPLFSQEILISGDETQSRFGPAIVAPQSVFVLSDHRGLGPDSRQFGGVPVRKIEARVAFIWLSLSWPAESNATALPNINWTRVFHSPD